MKSIMQDWSMLLGLRHQGVLLAAVRGCDVAPKEGPTKRMARWYRGVLLNAHCGDLTKAQSFMSAMPEPEEFRSVVKLFMDESDMMPAHYVLHLLHAAQIVGEYHPDASIRNLWGELYERMCRKYHVFPETRDALDERLGKSEDAFGADQRNA